MLKVCVENSIFLLELYLKLFMGEANMNSQESRSLRDPW